MANARFLYDNHVMRTAVTLTSSEGSWLLTRPLSFLLSPWRKKVARSSTGTTSVDVIIDLGSAKTLTAVFLVNPKLHTGGEVRIYGNATNTWSAPSFSSSAFPTVDTERKLTGIYFAAQTFRYWRLRFINLSAASDYVELGGIILGNYYEPSFNITEDLQINPNDPSRIVTAYDGERQSYQLTHFDTVDAFLEAMPLADRDAFAAMYNAIGTAWPLIFAVDSADLRSTYYGYFENRIDISFARGTADLWDIDFALMEAR